MTREESRKHGVRWWPLVVIAALVGIGVAVTQGGTTVNQQQANGQTVLVVVVGLLLVLAWLVLFSRLAPVRRLLVLMLGAAGLAAFLGCFRMTGMTGNLLPIFEWRWARESSERLEPLVALSAPAGLDTEPVPGLADFPEFFGPGRRGELPGPTLARDWTADEPVELWRHGVGAGWSGFAVAGRRAVTQEQRGEDEAVVCYDVITGHPLWVHLAPARYDNKVAGTGPRATPTIDGGFVYTQGSTGLLHCLDLGNGRVLWSTNSIEDAGAVVPVWGYACSPLVLEDVVVVSAGGSRGRSLRAYDRSGGAPAWSAGDDSTQYSSPVLVTLAGVEQILIFNTNHVAAHAPDDGRLLWTHPWPADHPHVCMPIACPGDRVLISSGYGTGSRLVQIERDDEGEFSATELWRSLRLKSKFANIVQRDGAVYGLDDGILTCIDLATGARRWKRGRYGHGQLLLVGDLLLVTAENGDVILVEADPAEARELTRMPVFDEKTWNPPALAGRYLLVRNDREAACFRLPVVEE